MTGALLCVAGVGLVALTSRYLCRLAACALLTWESALGEFRDALGRHWERNHRNLLAEPQPDSAGPWSLEGGLRRYVTTGAAPAGAALSEEA